MVLGLDRNRRRDASEERDGRKYSADRDDRRRRRGESNDRNRSSTRRHDRREEDFKEGGSKDKSKEKMHSIEKVERTKDKIASVSTEKEKGKVREKTSEGESIKKDLFLQEKLELNEDGVEREKKKTPKKKGLKRDRSTDKESPDKAKLTPKVVKDGRNETLSPNKKKRKESIQPFSTDLNKTIELNSTQGK